MTSTLDIGAGVNAIITRGEKRGSPIATGLSRPEAMVARLRAKPGAEQIEMAIGDFARTRVDGQFSLVYLLFDTIFNPKEGTVGVTRRGGGVSFRPAL